MQVGHVQQGVGQTRELCFLHRPAVSGSDDVDAGQDVGPRRGPAVDILGAHDLHDVPVLKGAGVLEGESILGVGATIPSVI